VNVAQAIIHEPQLLILDEPTRGLDPMQIVEMRGLVNRLKHDHTILVSSHILFEISKTCDRILVIDDGEIIARGTEEELSGRLHGGRRLAVTVRVKGGDAPSDEAIGAVKGCIAGVAGVTAVRELEREGTSVGFEVDCEEDRRVEVVDALVRAGHGVARIDVAQHELEGIFMQLVGGHA
jgi:ABC-2 type transport system ATP-binding protein